METRITKANKLNISPKKLKAMTIKEFHKFAESVIDTGVSTRIPGIALKFPYALNCANSEKVADCNKHLTYTAFLNNSGRLCHIICGDDPDLMIRIRFSYSIKHLSKRRQKIAIWHRVHNRINVGECPK